MPDPIASSTLTLVVDDEQHKIRMSVVHDAATGAAQLVLNLSLAIRKSDGQVIDWLEAAYNLTQEAMAGVVAPADVAALRRLLVALGQKRATDAGMTVVVPPAPVVPPA